LVLASACSPQAEGQHDALRELEQLAFVPVGECPVTSTIVCANEVPLLVDRYEVTRAAWLRWVESQPNGPSTAQVVYDSWGPEDSELPAGYLDHAEAQAFAASRGMRLLTASEWMRVASGTRRQTWPWGYEAISVANTLELGLREPVAVGTFEQGRTPLGTYDMLGNVWEWVDGRVASSEASGFQDDGRAWVMGCSYLTLQRSLLEPFEAKDEVPVIHAVRDRRHRAVDVGLRCAADAEAYLWERSEEWGMTSEARERLVAIGASWGAPAVPMLTDLADRVDAPPGLAWLAEGAAQ
jgi:formylglycine-generating enzyme required for sulfatase activity